MKIMYCLLLALITCFRVGAQVQELQQLKLDLEKLTQFKLILSQMKQGYQTLQNGYNAVRDISKGNYDLHKSYLDGLLQVNQVVKNAPALQLIFSNQSMLLQEYKSAYQKYENSGLFTAKELLNIKNSYQSITEDVSSELAVLEKVLSPGSLRMSDAERLEVIDKLNINVADQLSAVRVMNNENNRVLMLRVQQKRDREALRRLNGF